MSDEIKMQVAIRHANAGARLPWQAKAPDEELMAQEEGPPSESLRAMMVEALFTYLFADSGGRHWEMVATRVLVLMRVYLPWLLTARDMREVEELKGRVMVPESFLFSEFERLAKYTEWLVALEGVVGFLYPARTRWLYRGTKQVYLLARAFQPWLVSVDGKEMTYEEMAEVLEGVTLYDKKDRGRARSRWSAMVQNLLRKPIEQGGGTMHLQFGKSAGARAKMARSAMGNHNR